MDVEGGDERLVGRQRVCANWRTTDQEEVDRRRLRAVRQRMQIRNLTPEHPVFSNFLVTSASGQNYSVELRDLRPLVAACTCVDFQVNGLGTCKHVEAVLRELRTGDAAALRLSEVAGSSRIDLVPDEATGRVAVERNVNRLPSALRGLFDVTGLAQGGCSPDEICSAVGAAGLSDVRISQDVATWLARRGRDEERVRLRRAYEQHVRAGLYPPCETREPLLPYQREGMLHLAFAERALLADDLALDKASQAVAAVALLRRLGKVGRALVVAPRSRCAEWVAQIARLTALPSRWLDGEEPSRREVRAQAPFFAVVSSDRFLAGGPSVAEACRSDCVVLDAAQRVGGLRSRVLQLVKRIESRYLFVLAEMPLDDRIDDLYALMSVIDPHALGPLFRFNREFYVLDAAGSPVGYQNLPRLLERVRPHVLRRLKGDVRNETRDRTDYVVRVAMSLEQRARYEPIEARAERLLSRASRAGGAAGDAAELQRDLAMMRMLCDSPYILDGGCRVCPKSDEIVEVLRSVLSSPDEKAVVYSEWERMLVLVREACATLRVGVAWHTGSAAPAQRRLEVERFRSDPGCRILLSTDVGGSGLAFQQAGAVIHCDVSWGPERAGRRLERVWREGQARNVTVVTVVSEDSVEARLHDLLSLPAEARAAWRAGGPAQGKACALLEQAAAVLRPRTAEEPERRASPEALLALDPELGFASALAARLHGSLFACESRGASDGRRVLLVAVEGDVESAVSVAADLWQSWLSGGRGARVPELEVVGRGAYETLSRLVARGVLAEPAAPLGVRTLYRVGDGLDCPRLTPDAGAPHAHALRRQAGDAMRRARSLVARLAFDAARRPLEEAVLCLACAHAEKRREREPSDWREAVSDRFRLLWGDTYDAVRELLSPDGSPVVALRALSTKVEA